MVTDLLSSSNYGDPARRALVRTFGLAPDVATIEPYTPGRPGPHQVRVRMTVRCINPSDFVTIAGAYPSRTKLPFVPGFEGVGIVEELGPEVAGIRVGDRVLPIGSAGAWQDVKITEARWCFPVAAELSNAQAATSYVNPLTAWLMLHERVALSPGLSIAINAAGSSIGRMLIRMANLTGVRPIALVRTAAARHLLSGLDLTAVVVGEAPPQVDALREAAGGRLLDLAFDAVGGAFGAALASGLKHGGHFLHYGLMSGLPLPADLLQRRPDIRLELFSLRQWVHEQTREVILDRLARTARLVVDGVAASPIEAVYPLAEISDALRHNLKRGRSGKILITC